MIEVCLYVLNMCWTLCNVVYTRAVGNTLFSSLCSIYEAITYGFSLTWLTMYLMTVTYYPTSVGKSISIDFQHNSRTSFSPERNSSLRAKTYQLTFGLKPICQQFSGDVWSAGEVPSLWCLSRLRLLLKIRNYQNYSLCWVGIDPIR